MATSNKRRDAERRTTAAAKVAEMQRAQRAAERRRRTLVVSAVVIVAIVIAVVIVVVVKNQHKTPSVAGNGVGGSTGSYGFVLGKASAPASMVIYEDFQCPICKSFEDLDGATLSKYIDNGTLKVEYRPIAFLDRMSAGNNYSTRSLNAAACVSNDTDIKTWKAFHDILYKNQPPENTPGMTDAQLIAYAKQAGATSSAVQSCITDQTYKNWTVSATDAANKAGVTGTPTVKLNGKAVSGDTLGNPTDLAKAITDAAAAG